METCLKAAGKGLIIGSKFCVADNLMAQGLLFFAAGADNGCKLFAFTRIGNWPWGSRACVFIGTWS